VIHDVLSDLGKALVCSNDRFDPSPSGLQVLSGVSLSQFRDGVELLIKSRSDIFWQLDPS